eukprot:750802-Pyramimonas_sp.AAC.1
MMPSSTATSKTFSAPRVRVLVFSSAHRLFLLSPRCASSFIAPSSADLGARTWIGWSLFAQTVGGWVKMPNIGFWDACGRGHWGLRWSSLWGHE